MLARMLVANQPSLRILEASSAPEGLAIARSQRPDLVLLDLLMPGMSGDELLAALHRDPTLERTDVIVMSARDLDEEASSVGGELQLSYPVGFSLAQLARCVQALLAIVTEPGSVAREDTRARRVDRPVAPVW